MKIDFENKNAIPEKNGIEHNKNIEEINTFNKLMINTIKDKDSEFVFKGHNYTVCSDGVCVQTLINERFLYRIFLDEYKNSSLINDNLVKYM